METNIKNNVEPIMVSVLCITYNQEKFIRQCLESIIMQKTNFKYEVIVHDDASTDNTAKIIQEYEKKYPDIIKPIYQHENQFSKQVGIYNTYIIPKAKGKYIALCEGDDYWTDENKLQLEFDYMELHNDCNVCFHPVRVKYEKQEHKDYLIPKHRKKFTFEKLLKQNFIQTNSVMYRFKDNIKLPNNILPGDWYMHLYFAKNSNIGYINKVMSVYRKHQDGIWWENTKYPREVKYGKEMINFYVSIYSNITDNSDWYLKEFVIPNFRLITDKLYQYGKFDTLAYVYEKYPDIYNLAMSTNNLFFTKYKKYKLYFNVLIFILAILFLLLLFVFVFFI